MKCDIDHSAVVNEPYIYYNVLCNQTGCCSLLSVTFWKPHSYRCFHISVIFAHARTHAHACTILHSITQLLNYILSMVWSSWLVIQFNLELLKVQNALHNICTNIVYTAWCFIDPDSSNYPYPLQTLFQRVLYEKYIVEQL